MLAVNLTVKDLQEMIWPLVDEQLEKVFGNEPCDASRLLELVDFKQELNHLGARRLPDLSLDDCLNIDATVPLSMHEVESLFQELNRLTAA